MPIVCLDMEGVLVPEIWIQVAKETKISALKITTRDEPDYDKLMKFRLKTLRVNRIRLADIQRVIATMNPLPGALSFLNKLRTRRQVVILSDTYYEFAAPLIKKLGFPTLFCNWLVIDSRGFIKNYVIRQKDGKRKAVTGLKKLGFTVYAAGDSYNDLTMLREADKGFLFNAPASIRRQCRDLKAFTGYAALLKQLT